MHAPVSAHQELQRDRGRGEQGRVAYCMQVGCRGELEWVSCDAAIGKAYSSGHSM